MGQRGGHHLLHHLLRRQSESKLAAKYLIQGVECLSACNRACVVAYAAANKTTLMFGDLPPFQSASAILQLAEKYYASPDGIISRQERPDILKKGILARIPPLPLNSLP
jgi:predicted metal-binding protein